MRGAGGAVACWLALPLPRRQMPFARAMLGLPRWARAARRDGKTWSHAVQIWRAYMGQARLGNMGLRNNAACTVQAPRAVPRWPAGWRALPIWVHGCGFMDVCTPASGDRNRFAGGGHACMRRWRGCLAQRGLPFAGRNATGAGEARIQRLGLSYASTGTGRWQSPQLRELP